MTAKDRVAVVVLNWNGLQLTRSCLSSLLDQTYSAFEIHVVDNGSANNEADRLREEFGDRIRLHALDSNHGFAGGCNHAMAIILAAGQCEFIALLNNDAEAAPNWLEQLVIAGYRADYGAVACRMRLWATPDRLDNAGVWFLSNGDAAPRGRLDRADAWNDSDRVVLACGGGCLIRSSMLHDIGLFRDDFFANFEDTDLFLRATMAGYRIRYAPRAEVRHHLNATIRKVRDASFNVRSVRNASWAFFVNTPWPVLVLNLPGFVLSNLIIVLVMPLLGRPGVSLAFLRGRGRALCEARAILRERHRLAPLRRVKWWRIWWRQRSFLVEYARLLWQRIRGTGSPVMRAAADSLPASPPANR